MNKAPKTLPNQEFKRNATFIHNESVDRLKKLKCDMDSFFLIQNELNYTRNNIRYAHDSIYRISQYQYIRMLKNHGVSIYKHLVWAFRGDYGFIYEFLLDLTIRCHSDYVKKHFLLFAPYKIKVPYRKVFKPLIKNKTLSSILWFYDLWVKGGARSISTYDTNMFRNIAKNIKAIFEALKSDYIIYVN